MNKNCVDNFDNFTVSILIAPDSQIKLIIKLYKKK